MSRIYIKQDAPRAFASELACRSAFTVFQDLSQLTRDYGDKESRVIQNTVGNIFSGQVVGDTARNLSERFGKVVQQRQSMSINRSDTSTSISTQLDALIPSAKIANLSQGMFVGAVADNFGETVEQKVFHAQIVVDQSQLARERAVSQPLPEITSFTSKGTTSAASDGADVSAVGDDADATAAADTSAGTDAMNRLIQENYHRIRSEVHQIIEKELKRLKK